jgi:hypothetical protein
VHVFTERVGGGFGGKQEMLTEDLCVLATLKTGRPVKWEFTREEQFIGATTRHQMTAEVRLGARSDGTLTAVEVRVVSNTGAYGGHGGETLAAALAGPLAAYRCPNKKADGYAVYTNMVPGGGFRGYGSSQTTFAIECAIDDLAKKLGLDPFELRRRNMIRPDDWIGSIWGDPSDVDFGSYGLDQCMDRVECASEVVAQGGEQQTALSERNPLRENKRMLLLWLTRLVVQGHFRDARCDIEAGRPLDTHRLQGNRIPGTANQHIGTKSDPDRRASRRPGVGPG